MFSNLRSCIRNSLAARRSSAVLKFADRKTKRKRKRKKRRKGRKTDRNEISPLSIPVHSISSLLRYFLSSILVSHANLFSSSIFFFLTRVPLVNGLLTLLVSYNVSVVAFPWLVVRFRSTSIRFN